MAARRGSASDSEPARHRAASTPEGRENQLINLAVDLAERQLRDGTASAQVISHYLKAGSSREYLEQRRLEMDVELQKAKVDQIASVARSEELMERAIEAMTMYKGGRVAIEEEDYDVP